MLMSEMFGVERDTDFGVKGYESLFKVTLNVWEEEHLMFKFPCVSAWEPVPHGMLCSVIFAAPSGIIPLPPPLTDEQREQLKALYKIGYRYLTRTISITIVAHVVKPRQVMNEWIQGGLHAYIPYENSSVYRLPIKSDSEPYDIAKALGVGE